MHGVKRILIIDDETAIQESLEMFLREKGLAVCVAGTGSEGLEQYLVFQPQVIVLDIRLPDISGLEVLKQIMAVDADAKVIMITAYHDMETTIEAMRNGAYDYIHKPLDVDELDYAVTKSLRIAETATSSRQVIRRAIHAAGRHQIIGHTPVMRGLFKTIGLLSRNRATVLIEGETGSGKELIARVIHESSSSNDEPFITVDCTTLVDSLFESELFGHERGAFTGAGEMKRGRLELAGEGTIFLDEVGDLPLSLQAKLLRFLEYREFTRVGGTQTLCSKARIIAATNHNLSDLVTKGLFRRDLLFRLKVVTITLPPLRERMDDLQALVDFFIAGINRDLGSRINRIEREVMNILKGYTWPGNVRELKNVLTKAVLESRGAVLLTDAVETAIGIFPLDSPETDASTSLDELEKKHILKTMSETDGNLSAAARILGVSRPTLRKRLKQYGMR
ncbi:sigma-54-dependent transcriptional regulator [Desulfomonile tiedjei]|uniref:Response regulator with CheY-like receiver, AAA-type ATPase, and DNA-binding domains n=1 Tax=Desulfomonile tiedjei (strain ATCC 49306 / DSM 6799 / DCB-1) TaxID=706587 RepID=I4CD81_DESTA|nr:sigma-54 dependent transcriptional regulator [Desulfomonile tiedjei]AFM27522.1 response regulator with CheY-like receiver, AAA-type ATPase, and DNA-binding domains [Desulfomonile tiedjei DSM 6799]